MLIPLFTHAGNHIQKAQRPGPKSQVLPSSCLYFVLVAPELLYGISWYFTDAEFESLWIFSQLRVFLIINYFNYCL